MSPPPGVLKTALWLALVSGLIEGAVRIFQKVVLGHVIGMPVHVVWMAPVANLIWLGIPALGLLLAQRIWPRLASPMLVVGVLATIAWVPLMLLFTTMHKAAALLLAAGLGFQVARVATRRWTAFSRLTAATTIPLVGLTAALGVGIGGVRMYQERQALASVPAAGAGMPNVLLIIWDTVRGQSLSVYGYSRPTTPYLERFAQEGVRFDRAIATASWTLPSHGSMFTGRVPHELMNGLEHPLIDSFPNLAEVLARHGYATGGFIANTYYTTREHGLARGFEHYEDYSISLGTIFWCSRLSRALLEKPAFRRLIGYHDLPGRKSAAVINREFLGWIERHRDRPFFAFLNYFDAHLPYISDEPFYSRFVRDTTTPYFPRVDHVDRVDYPDLTAEEIAWTQDQYDALIAYQDQQVQHLMEELGRRGLLANTLVIITSDHGEHFGDHQLITHMNSLYRQLIQVPLLMRLPGRVPAGYVADQVVSLADLPRTVLDVAGVTDSGGIPGASLARTWTPGVADSVATRPPVLSQIGSRSGPFSLMTDRYHYISWRRRAAQFELYDVPLDPWETTNLIDRPELAETRQSFVTLSERMQLGADRSRTRPRSPNQGTAP